MKMESPQGKYGKEKGYIWIGGIILTKALIFLKTENLWFRYIIFKTSWLLNRALKKDKGFNLIPKSD